MYLSGDPITELDRAFDLFFIALLLTGAVSRNPRVHAALAAVSLAAFLAMVLATSMTPG